MKNKKRVMAGALSIMLILSTVGCQNKDNAKNKDDSVKLKWLLSGPGKQKDSELVWETFNEKLAKKMPNTKVDFESIAISDYAEKWKLISASGEKVDLAWQGWMLKYEKEVKQGSYLPIDDLLSKNAPKLKKSMPDWVWNNMKIDGKLYAVPCYQMMVSRPTALRTFKEYSDKYLDKDGLIKAFSNNSKQAVGSSAWSDEVFDIVEDYLTKLKNNNIKTLGFSPAIVDWISEVNCNQGAEIMTTYVSFDKKGKPIAHDSYANDITDTFYKRMAQLYKKGLIRKDVLTVQDYTKDLGKKEGYALWIHQFDAYTQQLESIEYKNPIEIIPVNTVSHYPNGAFATNMTLPKSCENPQKAMELLEVLNDENDTELYNLLVYGIEGKHYTKEANNKIKTLCYEGSPTADSAYGVSKWIIGNTFNAFQTQTDVEGYDDYVKNDLNVNAIPMKLEGFSLNTEPIKVELAQIENVKKEFVALRYGADSNYKERLQQYRDKIQKCGQSKVVSEIQKQLDVWYANKSK